MRGGTRFKVFWISIVAAAFLALAYLIVPPLLNLNRFRAGIQNALASEVGEPAQILGNVKISMLGYPMLSVENIRFEKMEIKTIRFRISWRDVFNLSNSKIKSGIKISGAKIKADTLSVPNFGRKIMISDSVVTYAGKDYEVLSGVIDSENLSARVRVNQHKYNINVSRGNFLITNPNEELRIFGKFATNNAGEISANGTFSISTNRLNEFFGFSYPKIYDKVKMSMNFNWDGKGLFDFSKIDGTAGKSAFKGQIKLTYENGKLAHKSVHMRIDNANVDLSFMTENLSVFNKSDFDVSVSGNIKTAIKEIGNLKNFSLKSRSKDNSTVDIEILKMDGEKLSVSTSGKIIASRADNLDIAFYKQGPEEGSVRCILSGNSKAWGCSRWMISSKNAMATGTISATETDFKMQFNSENMDVGFSSLNKLKQFAGNRNIFVQFQTAKKSGNAELKDAQRRIEYAEKDIEIGTLDFDLPKLMKKTVGNLAAVVTDDSMSFVFQSPDWSMSIDDEDNFTINHKDLGKLLSSMTGKSELAFLQKNIPVIITGKYDAGEILPNIQIKIGDMLFSGTFNNGSISLKTKMLDFDKVLDDKWFAEFIDNQYLSGDPMLTPFDFGANVAITADQIKMNGAEYDGFVYSLSGNTQEMSISDSENGELLVSIAKDKSNYKYLVQLDKFYVPGKIFGIKSPVNLSATTITAEAELATFGITAFDIRRNMTGIIDAAFDGGILTGLGTDQFYSNVNRYGKMDTENALHKALGGGETNIKEMQIIGEYNGGDFRTTKPFMLSAKYTDITGNFQIKNDSARVKANIILRGTSAIPKPIALRIDERGRDYSLSEILPNIDLDYLRQFVATHKRF